MSEQLNEEAPIPCEERKEADLADFMDRAAAELAELGEDHAAGRSELEALRQRLAEGRFQLAILGQFKRGKSSLLNALLGDDLLPTDILPVTAIPTFIRAGDTVQVRVCFDGDRDPELHAPTADAPLAAILADYVTEAGNPHNERGVERVEIAHPAELLRRGVVLIDTPGIGSTLRHNTEAAHQILPQCDAALFLVSADPPLTEMEFDFLGRVRDRIPRLFFLFNKVDNLSPDELHSSLQFLRQNLESHGETGSMPRIFPVSARQGLKSRLDGDDGEWEKSGMKAVEEHLVDFLAREKMQTLKTALALRTADLLDGAVMQLQLTLSALRLPVEELQQRLESFSRTLPEIEREQLAADDVLAGDLKRAVASLGERIEALRERARAEILPRIEGHLERVADPEEMEMLVRSVMAQEIPPFFQRAMRETAEAVREEASSLLTLNQRRSDRIMEQVRQTAAELFQVPYHAPSGGTAYTPFSPPSWSTEVWISDMDPIGQRISRKLFSQNFRRKRTVKRLREQCRSLLNQNVGQISWALRRSLDESFRHFGAELREQLQKTVAATRGAVEVALSRKAARSSETAAEEVRLQQALKGLQDLRQELK